MMSDERNNSEFFLRLSRIITGDEMQKQAFLLFNVSFSSSLERKREDHNKKKRKRQEKGIEQCGWIKLQYVIG